MSDKKWESAKGEETHHTFSYSLTEPQVIWYSTEKNDKQSLSQRFHIPQYFCHSQGSWKT